MWLILLDEYEKTNKEADGSKGEGMDEKENKKEDGKQQKKTE